MHYLGGESLKRIILNMSFAILLIFTLMMSGCDGNKVAEEETEYEYINENDDFIEKVIYSNEIDPEWDKVINMYLDENGDVQLNKTEEVPAYIDNEKKILFITPDGHDVISSTIRAVSNSGDEIFEFSLNEISGIENAGIGTDFCNSGMIFQMENGNLDLFLEFNDYIKLIEINIETMEVSNSIDFSFTEIIDDGYVYSYKQIKDSQTLFYNTVKGEILLYNNKTGVQEGESTAPGYDNDQTKFFKMGDIIKYGDYWYTITEAGIYRAKQNTFDWDCVIPREETTSFNHERLELGDLLIKSDDEIYVIIRSDFEGLNEVAVETFVKFEIK